jgi:putative nucleotidyltransferase with HDIG domain
MPSIRVLIVDDEPAAGKLLALFMERAGCDCRIALSGEGALKILEREPADAVFSDIRMPGMSGMQLLDEVHRRYPDMAFVVTTGVDDVRVGVQAMKAGADDYLVKPFREEVVLASLRRALDKKHLEQEVKNYRHRLELMVAERTRQLEVALKMLERSYEDTVEALGAAIDLRDSPTAGHSQRVCRYSLEIAKAMNLSEAERKSIAMGAYLHDIGKLGLPDGILLKPGPLTADERKIMQEHVQTGYALVNKIPHLADAAGIILSHHERFDGSGYLQGLKGDQIPLGARIFAVADTVDAMTSDRPYRRALPFEAGREEIRRETGRLFDRQVASAFLGLPAETMLSIAPYQ